MAAAAPFSIVQVLTSFKNAAGGSLKGPKAHLPAQPVSSLVGSENVLEWQRALEIARAAQQAMTCRKMLEGKDIKLPQPAPLLLSGDDGPGGLTSVLLDEYNIPCFEKGGEKRLCLPLVLMDVLHGVDEPEVQNAVDKLQMNLPRCSDTQLEMLKKLNILPSRTQKGCGLITLSDAERLYSYLVSTGESVTNCPASENSFMVYHECFGECMGTFLPELYTSPKASCIRCEECEQLFAPEKFVGHTHMDTEDRLCHWGFHSKRWRSYLLLADEQENEEKLKTRLERLKDKFLKQARKRASSVSVMPCLPSPKVRKLNKSSSEDMTVYGVSAEDLKKLQTSGPPKLLDPQKVVPFSERDKYDKSYIPNVCLAPKGDCKTVDDDDDDDDDDADEILEESPVADEKLPCSTMPSSGGHRHKTSCKQEVDTVDEKSVCSLAALNLLMEQVQDPKLRSEIEALHGELGREKAHLQRENVTLSQNLQLKERDLEAERESKKQSLLDASRLNKELWEEMAQKNQTHLKEKLEKEEQVSALQSYIKEVFVEKDKHYQEACQQFQEQIYRYETQLALLRQAELLQVAAVAQRLETGQATTSEKQQHEHYIKRLIRSCTNPESTLTTAS